MSFVWFDAFGRQVDTTKLKTQQASPVVLRRRGANHPAAGLTPGQLATILRSSIDGDPERYLALAEDIEERDNHYLSVLNTRKTQVAGLEVAVDAAGDDARSEEHADLVRTAINRSGFYDELIDIQDAVGKSFSCTQILWDTSAKQWMPRGLEFVEPTNFTFDPLDRKTPLLRGMAGPEPLNPFQWIYHTGKAKSGLTIRGGFARAVAWTFLFKSFTVKDWAIFCEAYGQPLRLGKWDSGASEADKEKLLEAVTNIGTDFAAIIPQAMTVEFIKADLSGSHELYEKRADWLDRQVSKVVLGQTATTDAIAGGHAVGKTHDKVRDDIEKSDARRLADTLNRDLVRPLIDLNYGPQKNYPTIRIGRPEEIDLQKFMGNVEKFVRLGGEVGMSTVRDKIGIPEPGAKEKLLTAPRSAAMPDNADSVDGDQPPEAGKRPKPTLSAAPRKEDAVDRGVDDALSDWEPLVSPIVAGLEAEIAAASSADEVKAILAKRFEGLDVAALTEQLARSAFAARLAGEADETL